MLIPLLLLGLLASAPAASAQETLEVTVTHYAVSGLTYAGGHTYEGMAACSWNILLGTVVRFADGREYRCEDRGSGLGSIGWVDIYVPSVARARLLGTYRTTVELVRP